MLRLNGIYPIFIQQIEEFNIRIQNAINSLNEDLEFATDTDILAEDLTIERNFLEDVFSRWASGRLITGAEMSALSVIVRAVETNDISSYCCIHQEISGIDWNSYIPIQNHTVDLYMPNIETIILRNQINAQNSSTFTNDEFGIMNAIPGINPYIFDNHGNCN